MSRFYNVDNPPPGYVLKRWNYHSDGRCTGCAADNNDNLCASTSCSDDKGIYIVVKKTLRDHIAEAVT